jgi:hypothetical protein
MGVKIVCQKRQDSNANFEKEIQKNSTIWTLNHGETAFTAPLI